MEHGWIPQPDQKEVREAPGLFNASLEDAYLYGGDLCRAALSAMELRGDRKHMIVDTKTHMLMPGMYPAIPGWHTDGAPRAYPKGPPDIFAQEDMRSPIYHLLVTGKGCLTDFVTEPIDLEVPDEPHPSLYEAMSQEMAGEAGKTAVIKRIPSCTVWSWDWWSLHNAIEATAHEWRYLIRVTETDYREPKRDLRDVLRTQQQVYVKGDLGW